MVPFWGSFGGFEIVWTILVFFDNTTKGNRYDIVGNPLPSRFGFDWLKGGSIGSRSGVLGFKSLFG